MLENLNKENRKNSINRPRTLKNQDFDEIEDAINTRASRGELKVNKNVRFESDQMMADSANGREETKKPSVKLPPVASARPPKAASKPVVAAPNQGKMPKYLEKYKEEAKQKQDDLDYKKNSRIPGQPPGTKLMDESERLQTLKDLEDNKK